MSQLQVVVEDEAWLIDKALYGFTRGTVLCMSHTLMWMSVRRQREMEETLYRPTSVKATPWLGDGFNEEGSRSSIILKMKKKQLP